MSRRNARDKKLHKKIALNRIQKLFGLAEEYALEGRLNLADRYVALARKISMRYLVPIPKEFKRCFCKHCYSYLLPSINCRIRINKGKIIVYCFNCNEYNRVPFNRRSS